MTQDIFIYAQCHLKKKLSVYGRCEMVTKANIKPSLNGTFRILLLHRLTREQIGEVDQNNEDSGEANRINTQNHDDGRIRRRIPVLIDAVTKHPHDNIMKIHGFFRASSYQESLHVLPLSEPNLAEATYAIYEDCQCDLKEYISEKGIEDKGVMLEWASQLISAIAHLHSKKVGVMHRRITPETIYIFKKDEKPFIKLGNILFARKPSNTEVTAERGLLLAYAAPESLGLPSSVTASYGLPADIWSYGMVLFYITHQKDPYPKEDTRKPNYQLREYLMNEANRPQLDDGVDDVLKEIIRECWKSESAERLTAAQIKAKLEKQLFPTVIESNH